ncbi:MAG TPA: hypothetical protein VH475_17920 [Tepidisphaeraceae bacterium]|jgi:hypothetical protein
MAKVLVERPRLGGGIKFQRNADRTWQRVPTDERPRRESMKQRWDQSKVQRKGLNENLAPLRRFLRGCVGRPWEQVCAEISERVDRASAVQLHIWQHVRWEVLTRPHDIERYMAGDLARGRFGRLYVDPTTGRLCEMTAGGSKRRRWAARLEEERRKRLVIRVEGRRYGRAEGIWYEVELTPLIRATAWDVMLRGWTTSLERSKFIDAYGWDAYASKRRQLCTKEIKRLHEALDRMRARCERRHAGRPCMCPRW